MESVKVTWAVDAENQEVELDAAAFNILRCLKAGGHLEVEPVYVGEGPQEVLARLTSRLSEKIPGETVVCPVTVLPRETVGKTAVETIAEYARKKKSDLILVSSHARQGFARLVQGSFASELLVDASVPVMVVGPNLESDFKCRRILFPTDLSDESLEAFKNFIPFAEKFNVELVLLKVSDHAEDLPAAWSHATRLPLAIRLQPSRGRTVEDWIVAEAAQKHGTLIAMGTRLAPHRGSIWESITVGVIEKTQSPVVCLHLT